MSESERQGRRWVHTPSGREHRPKRAAPSQPGRHEPARADSARALAFELLRRFDEDPAGLVTGADAEDAFERSLDARSRRFFHELAYGTLRRRLTLDCIIASYARDPISKIEPDCLNAMRLGVYQLLFLDGVPPFAAIDESVQLLAHRHAGVRSLANAVLRAIARDANKVGIDFDRGGSSPRKRLPLSDRAVAYFPRSVFADPQDNLALHLAQIHSHPPFLVERWLERFDRAVVEDILVAGNRRPPVSIRVNRLKTDRDGLLRRLAAEGVRSRPGALPDSILVEGSAAELVAKRAFGEGLFYVQDEAAMKVAPLLDPRPGERIFDLCAAPGGKATHLAELAGDKAAIVAADRDAGRLSRVAENAARLGTRSVAPLVFDALAPPEPLPAEFDRRFDALLLDVPCSNTGVLARRPEARWRVSRAAIEMLADKGRALLRESVKYVRPGGRIVFSTCSLEPEENQGAVTRAVVAEPALRVVRHEETLPSPRGQDGGFVALLERT